MTTKKANQPKSLFHTIDKSREDFVDDASLADAFTNLVTRCGVYDFPESVQSIHVDNPVQVNDPDGNPAYRFYAVWEEGENGQLFGAWFYAQNDEEGYLESEETLYPYRITTIVKKSQQIWEDVYYMERTGLPAVWVTYHNSQ